MAQILLTAPPGRTVRGQVQDFKTETGNIVEILVNGVAVGRATDLNFEENYGTNPLHEIGTMMPAEFPPTQWAGTLRIGRYALRQELVAKALGAASEEVLRLPIFDVQVRNRADNRIVETFQGCVPATRSKTIRVGAAVQRNHTFHVTDYIEGDAAAAGQVR
mgnify:CR=1 FL=1